MKYAALRLVVLRLYFTGFLLLPHPPVMLEIIWNMLPHLACGVMVRFEAKACLDGTQERFPVGLAVVKYQELLPVAFITFK